MVLATIWIEVKDTELTINREIFDLQYLRNRTEATIWFNKTVRQYGLKDATLQVVEGVCEGWI